MGKRWWRKVTGISNAQRQLSRKLGFRLSDGRPSRRRLFKGCCILCVSLLCGSASLLGVVLAALWR